MKHQLLKLRLPQLWSLFLLIAIGLVYLPGVHAQPKDGRAVALAPVNGPDCPTYVSKTTANGLGNDILYGVYAVGSTIYAATLDGVSISTDGGTSFTNKNTTNGLGSNAVLDVYVAGSTVYAATAGGVSISTDGGTSFTNKTTTSGLGSNGVRGVYVVGSTVYAATDGGLSISTNGGSSFTNKTTANGLGGNYVYRVYAIGSTVYAATEGGLSISTDGGTSFANKTTTNGLGGNAVRGVYATSTTVYAATNGGLSFCAPSITGVTTVNCTTISAGQRQIKFTPQYAGVSGQPISFSVVNEMLPTTAAGPYSLNMYIDNPVITLKATQSGTAGEASFVYHWLAACNGSPTPPPTPPFAITGVATVSCVTVSAGLRTVSFSPQYAGVSGQPISFSVVNEMLPTTAAGPYSLNMYIDNPVITFKASQAGTADEVSFSYHWLVACNGNGRLGAEPTPELTVLVLGNPVATKSVEVEIRGAAGQPLHLQTVNGQGQVISQTTITQAAPVERITLGLERSAGLYFLHVSTPTQRQVVKLLKP